MRTSFIGGCVAAYIGVFVFSVSAETLLGDASLDGSSRDLSFSAALQIGERNAPSLAADNAAIKGAQSGAIAAAALPDPKLIVGVDNIPVSGADRGSFTRDSMTMQKIGFMQEFPNADKRHARADIAAATTAKAQAEQIIERQKVRSQIATAWLNRWYAERELKLFDELDRNISQARTTASAQLLDEKNTVASALIPMQDALELADRRDELMQTLAEARAELRRWLGSDAELPLQGEPPAWLTKTEGLDAQHLRQQLHRHPELAAYTSMTAVAAAELRETEAEKKSDWGAELVYQRRGELFSDMVSLQFTWDLPVATSSRQNPRIEAKRQALAQLDNERLAMLRDHSAELDADIAQLTRIDQQLTRLRNARLPLAQQRIDLQMASYRAGQSALSDVIAARRDLLEMQLKQFNLENQYATLAAKLFFAYAEQS